MARQNDHTRAEELISAYLDKRVSAEEQDFFERHVASCAECRAQLETTRSLVAALRAMPVVKAPHSFVLPRETAKQPGRPFLSWYPALRLATAIAAMAFVVLFAGDLLISRSDGASALQTIPAAAPAPAAMQAPEAPPPAAPTQESAAAKTAADTAAAPAAMQAPEASPTAAPTTTATAAAAAERSAAPAAGAALQLSATAAMSESTAMSLPTAIPAATASAGSGPLAQKMLKATPDSAGRLDQRSRPAAEPPTPANRVDTPPAIDPLRVIEIAVLALAVVLGVATLIARRKQV
jgi:hypothetical protein